MLFIILLFKHYFVGTQGAGQSTYKGFGNPAGLSGGKLHSLIMIMIIVTNSSGKFQLPN